jgi:hypothetical protein
LDDEELKVLGFTAVPPSQQEKDLAEFMWTGAVFVSHNYEDGPWCRDNIYQRLEKTYGQDTCFLLSNTVGSPQYHLQSIRHSFQVCKTVLIVISQNSPKSKWMKYESRWAIEQKHPVIICLLGDLDPSFLRHEFHETQRPSHSHLPIEFVDFRQNLPAATDTLFALLAQPEFVPEPIHSPFAIFGYRDEFDEWKRQGKPHWLNGRSTVR